ncbi:molybdenum cofactor cytidylyltransferase [Propionivibrio dicarboxylicus]|uniref:Molybdenum cofactor cytidylyltransferase n=2 Tax=Propionivibrio dicarboxylicus TaxID=83767 RepID=A0A1G7WWH8_9RHOO|nr:molybdenum cofactor cytidylyltransferase [Propionivibrio dicarboxylicus]
MIVGILLAAGAGRRFGGDKLLAEVADGQCVAELSAARLAPAVDRMIAVVRPGDDALAKRLTQAGAEVRPCPTAHEGMGASLSFGVRQAPDADGWLIALADMPLVATDDIRRVADALRAGAAIALPVAGDRRGHPVGFSRQFLDELTALGGDAGARALLQRYAAAITPVPVADAGTWLDLDTADDLAALRQQTSAQSRKK